MKWNYQYQAAKSHMIREPVERLAGNDGVEARFSKGQLERIAAHPAEIAIPRVGPPQHPVREIASQDARRRKLSANAIGENAGAAAHVENPLRSHPLQRREQPLVHRTVGEPLHQGRVVEQRPEVEEERTGARGCLHAPGSVVALRRSSNSRTSAPARSCRSGTMSQSALRPQKRPPS